MSELVAELLRLEVDVLVAAVSTASAGGQESHGEHPHRHGRD